MRFVMAILLGLVVAACSSNQQSGTSGAGGGATETTGTASAAPQPTGPAPGTQAHLNETIGDRVFFGTDLHGIDNAADSIVSAWADWLRANPGVNVLVEGHCDERGTRDYNFALGERRSFAVKQALVQRGIDGARIEITTFGKERPDVLGSNPTAWSKNRRAVMVVKGGGVS